MILGRPKGRKSSRVKLTGKAKEIQVLRKYGMSISAIAKKMHVNRNTLAKYMKERMPEELAEEEQT